MDRICPGKGKQASREFQRRTQDQQDFERSPENIDFIGREAHLYR